MQTDLSSSKVVAHNAFFNLIGFLVSIGYMVFLIPILLKYLNLHEYGLWSLLTALTGYVVLLDVGLGMSFVKFIAEFAAAQDYDRLGKVIQHGLLFYFVLSLLVLGGGFLVFPILFRILNIPESLYGIARLGFFLALLNAVGSSVSGVFGSVLTGLQRTDLYTLFVAGMMVTRFVAVVFLLRAGYGLAGLMGSELATTLLLGVPFILATRRLLPHLSFRFQGYDREIMARLFRFGWRMQVTRFGELIQLQFDKLLLTRYIGLNSVSMYDFGSRPLVRLRAMPLMALSALAPAVSALDTEANDERIHSALVRGTRYLLVFALPLFSMCVMFAQEIIELWLGPGYERAAVVLQIFAVAYLAHTVVGVLSFVSYGKGEPEYQMRAMVRQVLLNIVLSVGLLFLFGFYGAVCGTTLSMILGAAYFYHTYGKQFYEHPLRSLGSISVKPLVSLMPALLIAKLVTTLLRGIVFPAQYAGLAISVFVGGVTFLVLFVVLLRLTKTFSEDDKSFIANVLPRRFRGLLRFL
jgi:O-antigen/teichoic acid export membrane protein